MGSNPIGGTSMIIGETSAEGFKLGINPDLISHPANCKLMIQNKNLKKGAMSSITIDELTLKINNWNKIYGVS